MLFRRNETSRTIRIGPSKALPLRRAEIASEASIASRTKSGSWLGFWITDRSTAPRLTRLRAPSSVARQLATYDVQDRFDTTRRERQFMRGCNPRHKMGFHVDSDCPVLAYRAALLLALPLSCSTARTVSEHLSDILHSIAGALENILR